MRQFVQPLLLQNIRNTDILGLLCDEQLLRAQNSVQCVELHPGVPTSA
jgi:hypothetical protein